METEKKLIPRERVCLMNAIAERDKLIAEQRCEVTHYRRQYEIAVKRRLHERHERAERIKDRITLAVLLCVIAFVFIPIAVRAFQQTFLWASGM